MKRVGRLSVRPVAKLKTISYEERVAMNILGKWLRNTGTSRKSRDWHVRSRLQLESLEARQLMAGDVLPVLMVVADQQDFYYREYGETRQALEAAGVEVRVAAATTSPSTPHWNTGQGSDGGIVTPDLALSNVDPDDYSAIVFVGGWGSSQYQYAFEGTYSNQRYNGDLATKDVVNQLIDGFLDQDKHVAAICHGVTVLAWARVDGQSPLAGHEVATPFVGSPAVHYQDRWYGNFELGQYEQLVANGALANAVSGQRGNPSTVADDVVVDGNIITAENYDSASYFGQVIAQEVLGAVGEPNLPATVGMVGNDLVVPATAGNDTIYVWSGSTDGQVFAWLNGESFGPFALPAGGSVVVHAGDGNDQVYATDARVPVVIFGEGGHDQITGGTRDDLLDGGEGVDRVWGGPGNDTLRGGAGDDFLYGREGNDVLVGGDGNDTLVGDLGDDLLIGGNGSDRVYSGGGQDILIGGTTSYDDDTDALSAIRSAWTAGGGVASRANLLLGGLESGIRLQPGATVHDDGSVDALCGGSDADLLLAALDDLYATDDLADLLLPL